MNRKRIIASILTLALTGSVFTALGASAEETAQSTEQTTEISTENSSAQKESDGKYEAYVSLLKFAGIDISSQGKDKQVTRLDFAKLLVTLMGENPDVTKLRTKEYFSDMPKSDKEAGYANYVYEKKLMKAESDGKFNANGAVTEKDIATIGVKLLGYDKYYAIPDNADVSQYVTAANGLKLFSGLKKSAADKGLDYEDLAIYLYNIFDTKPVVYENDGAVVVNKISDSLYMSINYNIYYETGIVTGDGLTSIDENAQNENIAIGGSCYNDSLIDATKLIGKNVKAFYKDDDGFRTLITAVCERNKILKLTSDEIEDFKDFTYTYKDGQKTKTEEISKAISIIYNGVSVNKDNVAKVEYNPEHGYIELIDNDNDSDYEVLNVWDYKCYVPEGINTSESFFVDKFTSDKISFEESNYENMSIFGKNGEVLDATAVTIGKCILIAESLDGKSMIMYAYDGGINGEVKSKQTDSGLGNISINDVKYFVPNSLTGELEKVKVGQTVTIYTDLENRVFAISKNADSKLVMAYLINAFVNPSNDDKLTFKYYDMSVQQVVTKAVAQKVTIDGGRYKTVDAYKDKFINAADKKVKYQPLRVRTNSANEITEIDTADNTTNIFSKNDGNLQAIYLSPTANSQTGEREPLYVQRQRILYLDKVKSIYHEAILCNTDTPVLAVPANRNDTMSYAVKTMADYSGSNVMDFYKINDEGLYPDIVVCYGGNGAPEEGSLEGVNHTDSIEDDDDLSAVENITTVVNSKDEIVTRLTLLTAGVRETLDVYDSVLATKTVPLASGDLIKYALNSSGEIWGIKRYAGIKEMKKAEGMIPEGATNHSLNVFRMIVSNAYLVKGDALMITLKDPRTLVQENLTVDDVSMFSVGEFGRVHKYNPRTKQFETATASSINDYLNSGLDDMSKIVIRTKHGGVVDMFIYGADALK